MKHLRSICGLLSLAAGLLLPAVRADTPPLQDPRDLTPLNERLLFGAWRADTGQGVWSLSLRSGALEHLTPQTGRFRGGFPSGLAAYGGAVYFALDDGVHGLELWRSEGTADSTRLLADLLPGREGATPGALTVHGGTLFFVARAGGAEGRGGFRLWRLDSSAPDAQPQLVAGAQDLANPRQLTRVGQRLYFSATRADVGHELWVMDDAQAAPRLVRDIRAGREDGAPTALTALGNTLYFSATDGRSGHELWASDGTAAGTRRVMDIAPGEAASRPAHLTAVQTAAGPRLFFSADDGQTGPQLWTSDGSAAGTRRVRVLRPGPSGAGISAIVAARGQAWFAATDGEHGVELWRSDGTEDGTALVADLQPGPGSALPTDLAVVGDRLLFSATPDGDLPRAWELDLAAGPQAQPRPLQTPDGLPLLQPSRYTDAGAGRIAFVAHAGGELTPARSTPPQQLWLLDRLGHVQAAAHGLPLAMQLPPPGLSAHAGAAANHTNDRSTP